MPTLSDKVPEGTEYHMVMKNKMGRPTQLLGEARNLLLTPRGEQNCRLVETEETCRYSNEIVVVYTHFGHLGYVMIVGFVTPDPTINVVVMGIFKRDGTQYLDNASFLTIQQKNKFEQMRNALFQEEAEHKPQPIHLDLNIVTLGILIPLFCIKIDMTGYYAWEYSHHDTNATVLFLILITGVGIILDGKFIYQNILKTLAVCMRTTVCVHGLGTMLELAVLWFTGANMVVPWCKLSMLWNLYELSGIKNVDYHIILPF